MDNQFILTPFFLAKPLNDLESLAQPAWKINRPTLPNGNLQQRLSAVYEPIAAFVAETIARGERPISIAGDCCATIGVLAGIQRAGLDPVLIWLDAHGDFNTWETSPSGFLGGMPLAMIVGRGEQTLVQAVGLEPLREDRVILAGARELDAAEEQAVANSLVHSVADVRTLLNHPLIDQPLYIHLDTDIVNPDDAPAMGYRAPGGPSAAELQTLFRTLARTGRSVAVSMTTWNPELDRDGRSRAVCMELLHALID